MYWQAMIAALGLAGLILAEGNGWAAQPPTVSIQKLEALPIQVPAPYDTSADAESQLKTALTKAKSQGKRVLVDMGGNWCPDCVILSNIMRLPEVAPFIAAHYEVVLVDVGRFNKNMEIQSVSVWMSGLRALRPYWSWIPTASCSMPVILPSLTPREPCSHRRLWTGSRNGQGEPHSQRTEAEPKPLCFVRNELIGRSVAIAPTYRRAMRA